MDLATAILTGLGLAAAAGLNAYIPLLIVGVLQNLGVVDFGDRFELLANPWVLGAIAVLLAVEVLADKIPVVDSANDVIQTVVRPVAGAVLFAASTGVVDVPPEAAFVAGLLTAGTVHATKALARPVLNSGTAGVAAPVVSTGEDLASTALSFAAVFVPVLILVAIAGFIWFVVRTAIRRRAGRAPVPAAPR